MSPAAGNSCLGASVIGRDTERCARRSYHKETIMEIITIFEILLLLLKLAAATAAAAAISGAA